MNILREIKYFWQRGRRGYSDRDSWSIDNYLNSILIPMLTDLRNRHIGYPVELAEDEWDLILSQIVMGLEANDKIRDLDYDEETIEALQLMSDKGLLLLGKYWKHLWD